MYQEGSRVLLDKVALITNGHSGIGRGIAVSSRHVFLPADDIATMGLQCMAQSLPSMRRTMGRHSWRLGMARVGLRGGDFLQREVAFFESGFALIEQLVPISALAVADFASVASIRAMGGDEALVDALERLPFEEKFGPNFAFLAVLNDGRMLLGSTDLRSLQQICRGRRLRVEGRVPQCRD
jgi:hypothetical protein